MQLPTMLQRALKPHSVIDASKTSYSKYVTKQILAESAEVVPCFCFVLGPESGQLGKVAKEMPAPATTAWLAPSPAGNLATDHCGIARLGNS